MFPERNWYYVLTKRSMHVKSKSKQMNLIINSEIYYVYALLAELVKLRPFKPRIQGSSP